MDVTLEAEYHHNEGENDHTEETFSGFSPELNYPDLPLRSLVKAMEANIEKMAMMPAPQVEISHEEIKAEEPPPSVCVPEDNPKLNESQEESMPTDTSSQVSEPEPVKPTPEGMISERPTTQDTTKSEPSTGTGFLLPFYQGWRREVNMTEKEVCYIHPFGARFKNIHDLSQQLTEGLSAENFTFEVRQLGANPEYETVTHTVRKSGRVPVPSSNYKIAERLEEESRKRTSTETNVQATPVKRGKLVLKIKSGRSENHENGDKVPKKKSFSRKSVSHFRRNEKTKWTSEKVEEEPRRNCTMKCPMAMGLIPSLQCCVCLCLYHPECAEVGRTGSPKQIHGYVCKSCRAKPENRKPAETPPMASASSQRPAPQSVLPPPPPSLMPLSQAAPQHIITLNRRRFVMVPNYLASLPTVGTSQSANPVPVQPLSPIPAPAVAPTPTPAIKPEVQSKLTGQKLVEKINWSFMTQACESYNVLLKIFKHLSVSDLGRVAQACRLFRDLAQHPSLWEKVKLKRNVGDWKAFSELLAKRQTRSLDLRDVFLPPENQIAPLIHIRSLEKIYFPQTSLGFLKLLLHRESNIRACFAEISEGSEDDQGLLISAPMMEVLHLRHQNPTPMPLKSLDLGCCASNLVSLSLLSFTNLHLIDLSSLRQLSKLTDLQFGNCALLPVSFCEILAGLTELINIRLEVGGSTCPLVEILETLRKLPKLNKLELIHFDCPPGFENALANMTNLQRLLIVPLFEFQMAAKVNAVLSALYKLKDNLTEMCWIFLIEIIQVSEMFFNHSSIRRGAGMDNFVPITLPLPLPEDTSSDELFWSELMNAQSSNNYIPVSISQLQMMSTFALRKTKTQLLIKPKMATLHLSLDELLL